MRRALFTIFLAFLVTSVAVTAGVVFEVHFEKPLKGVYSGPGVPQSKVYNFDINANDSYYVIPIVLNYSKTYYINETITTDIYSSSENVVQFNTQYIGLMNLSDFKNLSSNTSLNFLITGNSVGSWSYEGSGNATYYAVYINSLNTAVSYSGVTFQVNGI